MRKVFWRFSECGRALRRRARSCYYRSFSVIVVLLIFRSVGLFLSEGVRIRRLRGGISYWLSLGFRIVSYSCYSFGGRWFWVIST